MKKNLFGAVAVGLALALAFTGCESGNDNALRVPTDADWAEYNKKSFSFVSTPNDYTSSPATYFAEATEYGTGGVGSWVWYGYKDGKNAWNRDVAAYTTGSNYTKTRGDVAGDKVGDVIKTKKATVTLNTGDYTWSMVSESTNKEVFALKNYTVAVGDYAYGYASRKKIPFFLEAYSSTSYNTFSVTKGTAAGGSVVIPGRVMYGTYTIGTTTVTCTAGATEAAAREWAIAELQKAVDGQKDYIARLKDNPDADKTTITAAEDLLATYEGYYANARAQRDGAAYVILEETTKDGVTKSVTTWTKEVNGTGVVQKEEKTSGTESKTEGQYKILKGNYISGSFLVTRYNKVTFADTDEKNNGTYTDAGERNHVGSIARDYPIATTDVKGEKLQYAGRVFVIENKILRGNEAVIDSKVTTSWKTRDNIFGWTYQSYENKHKDHYSYATAREYMDANRALVTYQGQ